MFRNSICSLALFFAIPCMAMTTSKTLTVQFNYDDPSLSKEAIRQLNAFITTLDLKSDHMFIVTGHTDDDGSTGYNDLLSLNRALSVQKFLEETGIPNEEILIHNRGELEPLVANITSEDHRKNRRVTLVFEEYRLKDMSELEDQLGRHNETHVSIDPTKRNHVRGDQGGVVRIEANSFVSPSGQTVSGQVDVVLTEALSLDNFVAEGLSTITDDGRILVSAGMIRVEAFDENGEELDLAQGADLTISLPAERRQEGMELFVSNNGADWSATGQEARKVPEVDLPERPRYAYPKFICPKYVSDISTKPRRPIEPVRPREPQKPRKESYTSKVYWYDALFKNKIQAKDEVRYERALEQHQRKMDKYDKRVEKYKADRKLYPEARTKYKEDLALWYEKNADDSLMFEETVVANARKEHSEMVKIFRERTTLAYKDWRVKCDSVMEAYGERLDSLGIADMNSMNRYIFTTNRMGWINCDRFYDVPESQKFDLVIQDQDTTAEKVYVVFTNIKSMIQMRKVEDVHVVSNIPKNEPAAIFAYKVVDGKSQMCYKPVSARGDMELDYRPAKFAEIRKVLMDLNAGMDS